jgi:hypothetical protein
MLKKVRIFLFFDIKTKFLLVEAFIFLAWARITKSMSFSKVAPSLGEQMSETSLSIDEGSVKVIKNISQAIKIMSRYTFWESMCLVKAIAAMRMLERRNIESTIYFGTAKDATGKIIAHAWLRSGSYYLTGYEEMSRFTVISKFAKRIRSE